MTPEIACAILESKLKRRRFLNEDAARRMLCCSPPPQHIALSFKHAEAILDILKSALPDPHKEPK